MTTDLYEKREQTRIKHYILQHYLARFGPIVGSRWDSITYVDGFAGPWNVRSLELKDSSFYIAIEELRKARATHHGMGRDLRLRCFFLEENRDAYQQLKKFAEGIEDIEVKVLNGSFEQSVSSILNFIRVGGHKTFPFIFIDPTGWTGFACQLITPLLKLSPGEVLINFMTGHIRRFLSDNNSRQSFEDLFGSPDVVERVAGLVGQDLDDALVDEYSLVLKREGRFEYVLPAIVLHPEIDRTHFHLIYATRHPRGLEVFKDAEESAMPAMEMLRAGAQLRRQEERTRQIGLFSAAETATTSHYYDQLRDRYQGRAQQRVLNILKDRKRVSYTEAWALALEVPLVWEKDLRAWIEGWRAAGWIKIEGLQKRERVLKQGHPHFLVWLEERS